MRFKVDENLPLEVAALLAQAGHDASTVIAQQLSGSADPNIAAVCRAERRALVTLDTDFADIRTYPPGHTLDWLCCDCGDRTGSTFSGE